ncbi:MAG TPA: hypothetical protein DCS93_27785 [Microscillaceae bacterium]|nr:hypothetical protein [Microscillaceae bacterium]
MTLLCLGFFLFFGCAKKEQVNPTEEPTLEEVSGTITVKSGGEFKIKGSNFSETERYVVKFNGVQAEIVKITESEITVTIPENITSGDITLEHNGKTAKVASYTVASTKVYIFQYDDGVKKLAEINLETGDLTYITGSIDYGNNTRGIVYSQTNEEFIGFDFDSNFKPFIIKIKPDGTTSEKIYLKGTGKNFRDLVIDASGKVYIFQYDTGVKKLAEINLTTGDLTYITGSIDYGNNTRGIVYNKTNEEFIGFDFDSNFKSFIIKIKPDGTTSEKIYLKGTGKNFRDLVIDASDKVYIFQYDTGVKKLAEINLTTGDLTYITGSIDYGNNTRGLVYSEVNDEFVGFDFDSNFKPFIIKIKPDGTTSDKIYLKGTGKNFTDLVIVETK